LIPAEPGAVSGSRRRTNSTDNNAAVARPLASVQPERKTPPRAGLKYWDERTQRVVELVPPAQCPTSRGVPLVHKKFLTAGARRGRMKSRRQRGSLKHSLLK
jgi:hypothetical protein